MTLPISSENAVEPNNKSNLHSGEVSSHSSTVPVRTSTGEGGAIRVKRYAIDASCMPCERGEGVFPVFTFQRRIVLSTLPLASVFSHQD